MFGRSSNDSVCQIKCLKFQNLFTFAHTHARTQNAVIRTEIMNTHRTGVFDKMIHILPESGIIPTNAFEFPTFDSYLMAAKKYIYNNLGDTQF